MLNNKHENDFHRLDKSYTQLISLQFSARGQNGAVLEPIYYFIIFRPPHSAGSNRLFIHLIC